MQDDLSDRIEALKKIGSLKSADRDQSSIDQHLQNANAFLSDAKVVAAPQSRFALAYEGLHHISLAVLEHLSVRPDDTPGHRQVAFELAFDALGIRERSAGLYQGLLGIHRTRNDKTYRKPHPPVSQSVADATLSALASCLPIAQQYVRDPTADDVERPGTRLS